MLSNANHISKKFLSIAILTFFLLAQPAFAEDISVIDGDTIKIDNVKIRLWGIDAPEIKQNCKKDGQAFACGKAAKMALESFIKTGGGLKCQVLDIDRYNRKVARCTLDDADLGRMMIRLGYAIEYERYSKGFYADAQADAVAYKRGLWAMEFQNPWDWRRSHR